MNYASNHKLLKPQVFQLFLVPFDFETKKQKYFTTKKGICNFAFTTQVLMEKEWTPEIIEKRQKVLIDKLKELWRL